MMLMPSIFGEDVFDNFFEEARNNFMRPYQNFNKVDGMMQTDIKEKEDGYEVKMNLPGFTKENVKGELKDGYLIISANTSENKDEKDANGRYIRRERYSGSCSRSFYVGDNIEQDDIHAEFKDGILTFEIPKKKAKEVVEEKKYIAIEG